MKVISGLGAVVGTGALALLAGCSGGSAEEPRSAPPSSAPSSPAHSTPPPSADPIPDGPTPPESPDSPPPEPPKPPAREPVIGAVWTTPRMPCDSACTLTQPVGTVTIHARVSDATRMEVFLVPTGTDTWSLRKSIGVDRNGDDGWSVQYAYADQPLLSHVVVVARGPGGTAEKTPFRLYHPDPR